MSGKRGASRVLLAHCGPLGWLVSPRPLRLLGKPIVGDARGVSISPQVCVEQQRWGIGTGVRDVLWGRRHCLATVPNRKGGGGRTWQQNRSSGRPLMNDKIVFAEVRVANVPSKNGGTSSEMMKIHRAKQLATSLGKDLVLSELSSFCFKERRYAYVDVQYC